MHERGLARARHDGAAVLELAVVGQDDVEHGLAGRREAVDPLDLAAHEVVAERDLAVELAGVGQLDRAVVRRVGLDLADVVQQGARDCDVAVEAREGPAHRADALGHRQAVLEQAVAVGLVVVLGRGRLPPAAPSLDSGPSRRLSSCAGAAAGPWRSAPEVALIWSSGAAALEQVGRLVLAALGGAQGADREAAP